MEIQLVDINSLSPAEKNVRMHGQQQIVELSKSIESFGQIRPIVTDEKGVIIAGHGLWETLKYMGETQAKVLMIDGLSESEKKKLMLADNKIYELGNTDYNMMIEVLEEIKLDGINLDIPGYDQEVLDSLLADTDNIDEKLSQYGNISDDKIKELEEDREALKAAKAQPQEREVVLNNDMIKVEQKKETDRPKPYIECPECGEKIWL
jgi:ParB-like chromosome segregation protein Spo0J